MHLRKLLIAGLMLACGLARAQQQLEPPDASFFVETQPTRSDFEALGLDDDTAGLRLRLGMWLNDRRIGRWKIGVEGAFFRMGESNTDSTTTRPATQPEKLQLPTLDTVTIESEDRLEITGLEVGVRLYDDELLSVRAGGYLYSYRERHDEFRTLRFTTTPDQTVDPASQANNSSAIGPYLGLALKIPVSDRFRLITEASQYLIEGERINNFGIGLRYESR